jgi:hypothetical protein
VLRSVSSRPHPEVAHAFVRSQGYRTPVSTRSQRVRASQGRIHPRSHLFGRLRDRRRLRHLNREGGLDRVAITRKQTLELAELVAGGMPAVALGRVFEEILDVAREPGDDSQSRLAGEQDPFEQES